MKYCADIEYFAPLFPRVRIIGISVVLVSINLRLAFNETLFSNPE